MSQLFIVPKKVRESMGKDAFGQKPVGTGPYKFVENVSGQRMVLEAFQDHWRGVAFPQKLTIRLITDPATRVAELKTGGAQLIMSPALTQLKELDQGPTQVMSLKGARTIMYCFNTTTKPFDDMRVRQAVNYAVDRESILKDVLEGNGVLLHGPWANAAWPGYDPDLKPYPYDPAKAKQLLNDAGYGSGFETTLNLSNGSQLKDRDIAEAVASQLGEVGIKLRLIPTDGGKLNDDYKAGSFEGIIQVFWSAPADPGPMIVYAFDKVKAQKDDPKLNDLVLQSRRAVDPDQRAKILKDMGQYVNDQALWLFIHAQNEFYAKRRELSTWEPIPEYTYGSIFWYQITPR
jgi:peptide/nickel transport system substrate-binding protein